MRKTIHKKLNQALDLMGPGLYNIRMITDMVNSLMPTPLWITRDIASALMCNPRVEYLGRPKGHGNGQSMYRVIA